MRPSSSLIVVVLLAGYLVGLSALLWGLADISRIPGGVWRHAAQRPHHQWRIGMISAYALGGSPAIVAVFMWWRSHERSDLLTEWAELSERKRARRRASSAGAAVAAAVPADEPAVVLADYEGEPAREPGHADA